MLPRNAIYRWQWRQRLIILSDLELIPTICVLDSDFHDVLSIKKINVRALRVYDRDRWVSITQGSVPQGSISFSGSYFIVSVTN